MSVKHTPGPWFYEAVLGQVGRFESADGVVVAQAKPIPDDYNRETRNANARLIAAAPDLLAALLAVVRVADRKTDEFDAARAAITKATGDFV